MYLHVGEAGLQLQRVRVVLVRARAQRGALLLQVAQAPRRAAQRRVARRARALQLRHLRLQLRHARLARLQPLLEPTTDDQRYIQARLLILGLE